MRTNPVPAFGRLSVVLTLWLVSLVSAVAATQTDDPLIRQAEAFVDQLQAGQFTNGVARFDKTMASVLPAEKLATTWMAVSQQVGDFEQRHGTRTESLGVHRIVLVTCEFARDWLDAKVVFNPAGEIAGLFFLPARKPDAQFPPYAKTNEFREVEARFGAAGWELPGTLTLPKGEGRFPAVILVHGSGPNDRDETIGPNKPFRDLAWGLASRGIAVLRYDKRTKVHAQKLITEAGRLEPITVREETMDDAGYALDWLRQRLTVDANRIFLAGHSLGATLAPRIARDHPGFAGLILLAGSTRPLAQVMVEQIEYIAKSDGNVSEQEKQQIESTRKLAERVAALTEKDGTNTQPILGAPPAYWLDLRSYDAPATAAELRLPMLILQGTRDYQVTEKQDLPGWRSALANRMDITLKTYPNLYHLFIAGKGPSTPAEYQIPGFVDEQVIGDIAQWIMATAPANR